MKKVILLHFIISLVAVSAIAGYMYAEQTQEEQEDTYSNPSMYQGMEKSKEFSFLNETIRGFETRYDYKRNVFDCREFSALLDEHLYKQGFDSGLAVIVYEEETAHRIN